MEAKVNHITEKKEYEYIEAEIIEVTIDERVKAIGAAYEWKQRVNRIQEDNESRPRSTAAHNKVPIQPEAVTRVPEHTEERV
jgi:hypothetical protein